MICKRMFRRTISTCMVLFLNSNGAAGKALESYLSIAGNQVESDNYELRNTNTGSVNKVILFDTLNHHIIVSWGWGVINYSKINEKGYIIDSYRHESSLLASGVFFDEYTYVDWVITGNKMPRKYSSIIDADTLSEQEFKRYINSADEVEYNKFFSSKKRVRVYLKIENNWMVLETSKRFNDFSLDEVEAYPEVSSGAYPKKKNNRLILLTAQSYRNNWDKPANKVSINYFDKQGSSSRRFMDINNMTWDGDYGIGYFQMKHQDEVLYFKAHTTKSNSRYSPDIEVYVIPEQFRSKVNISLLELRLGSKNKRSPDEAGLYVLREKISTTDESIAKYEKNGISFGTYLYHKIKFDWKPVFTGFAERSGEIHNIHYFTGLNESINKSLASGIDSKMRTLPERIVFEWNGSKYDKGVINILFDKEIYQWDVPRKSIYFKLSLNRAEMINVFQQLSVDRQPIQMELKIDSLDNTNSLLSVWVSNGNKSFRLKAIDLETLGNNTELDDVKLHRYFEKSQINKAYQAALKNINALPEYLETLQVIANNSDYIDDYAFLLADHTTKLLISALSDSDFSSSKRLLIHYINIIIPRTGRSKKTDDVASLGLTYCINAKDKDFCKIIFDELLPELNIEKLDNKILLFNLACYYSVNNKKEKMLKSIKQSKKYGKTPDQFMRDSDFKAYWNDTEFIETIHSK